jgi:Leucine-rich repeat (LRR) protein
MKQILLMIAVVALVGCGGGKQEETQALSQPEPETPPQITETPQQPKTTNEKLIADPIVEKEIRYEIKKPTGNLVKADYEKVIKLFLSGKKLTEVPKGLEKLPNLMYLWLPHNKLTDVKGLEKLPQLSILYLHGNPVLTKAQIAELQKALPNCTIHSDFTK